MAIDPQMLAAIQQAAAGGGQGPGPMGPGPMDQGQGVPPDIMAALGGQDQQNTISQGGSPGGGSDLVGQAIDILNQAAQEEADDQDKQTILTCIANLQGVLANNQKDADSMMAGKMNPRALRKVGGAGV